MEALALNMTQPLSPATIALVKATAPALQKHGVEITTRMYERLFVKPEIKALFDDAAQISGEQPKRLAAAILAFAKNADNVSALGGAVESIARRHVKTHIKPEHYPAVAEALLPAIKDVLGDAIDEQVLQAWGEAYWFLANIFIAREAELYRVEVHAEVIGKDRHV
jgi:hemoglobin-like flavoprotein